MIALVTRHLLSVFCVIPVFGVPPPHLCPNPPAGGRLTTVSTDIKFDVMFLGRHCIHGVFTFPRTRSGSPLVPAASCWYWKVIPRGWGGEGIPDHVMYQRTTLACLSRGTKHGYRHAGVGASGGPQHTQGSRRTTTH